MDCSLKATANTFVYLSSLLEIAYDPTPEFICAQLKKDTKRCGNRVTKDSLQQLKESFGHLFKILKDSQHILHHQDGIFDTVLTQLIASCLCRSQHQKNAEHARAQWLKELYNQSNRHQLLCELQACLSTRLEESIDSALFQPVSTEFELCHPETRETLTSKHDVALKVTTTILEQLKEKDSQAGNIYLIAHPQEPNMFKIGHTNNIEVRFNNHKQCYGDFKEIKIDFIPYARRIEQLMLAEFSKKHYRLREKCPRCGAIHKEWIKASKASLIKALNKWIKFAKSPSKPYNSKDGRFRSGIVAMPPSAMVPVSPSSTPTKQPRRSDVVKKSPKSDEFAESGDNSVTSVSDGVSKLDLTSQKFA
jgi:hypothetical protein